MAAKKTMGTVSANRITSLNNSAPKTHMKYLENLLVTVISGLIVAGLVYYVGWNAPKEQSVSKMREAVAIPEKTTDVEPVKLSSQHNETDQAGAKLEIDNRHEERREELRRQEKAIQKKN